MQKSILFVANDPMGAAIYDYHKNGKAGKLRVFSSCMEEDEIPVAELFRTFSEMPSLEQIALEMATGKILDVGGGSGCHSLALKEMGKETMAIDISPLAVEVMRERGINAKVTNFYDENFSEKFDTILLLMNGSGIIGNIKNMEHFFLESEPCSIQEAVYSWTLATCATFLKRRTVVFLSTLPTNTTDNLTIKCNIKRLKVNLSIGSISISTH